MELKLKRKDGEVMSDWLRRLTNYMIENRLNAYDIYGILYEVSVQSCLYMSAGHEKNKKSNNK